MCSDEAAEFAAPLETRTAPMVTLAVGPEGSVLALAGRTPWAAVRAPAGKLKPTATTGAKRPDNQAQWFAPTSFLRTIPSDYPMRHRGGDLQP